VTTIPAGPATRWPAPDPVVAGGRRLALHRLGYDARGDPLGKKIKSGGVPILLLHGLEATGRQWNRLAPNLPGGRRILAPDLPGFGGSERRGSYTASAVSATLAALVLEEAGRPVDVIGHDWGATLAIALAATRPDLVRRLGLLSGGWPPALPFGPGQPAPGLTWWRRSVQILDAGAPRRVVRGYLGPDPALSGIPRPERSLVIWGARDRRLSPRCGEQVVTALGRCVDPQTVEMVTLPGVGAAPHVTAAGPVGALLGEFLRAS
jgi:pimeloyl-ACP methyl ester carboxylesterase